MLKMQYLQYMQGLHTHWKINVEKKPIFGAKFDLQVCLILCVLSLVCWHWRECYLSNLGVLSLVDVCHFGFPWVRTADCLSLMKDYPVFEIKKEEIVLNIRLNAIKDAFTVKILMSAKQAIRLVIMQCICPA